MFEVRAMVFKGKKTARQALRTLEEQGAYRWIDDVAEISRSKRGFIKVHSTWAQDDTGVAGGIGWGAITGGLLGALMGPAGALAGAAAGGGIGGLIGLSVEVAVEDPRLSYFAEKLTDDTSALVLVADEATAGEFVAGLAPFDGELIETTLDEQDVKRLREKLRHRAGAPTA